MLLKERNSYGHNTLSHYARHPYFTACVNSLAMYVFRFVGVYVWKNDTAQKSTKTNKKRA